jgi:hypothetical protein
MSNEIESPNTPQAAIHVDANMEIPQVTSTVVYMSKSNQAKKKAKPKAEPKAEPRAERKRKASPAADKPKAKRKPKSTATEPQIVPNSIPTPTAPMLIPIPTPTVPATLAPTPMHTPTQTIRNPTPATFDPTDPCAYLDLKHFWNHCLYLKSMNNQADLDLLHQRRQQVMDLLQIINDMNNSHPLYGVLMQNFFTAS